MHSDPGVEIVAIDGPLMSAGFELFARYVEKFRTLADCVSFVVMREGRITGALTADRHCEQAGFRALLSMAAKHFHAAGRAALMDRCSTYLYTGGV